MIFNEITYKCSLTGDVKDIIDTGNIMKQLNNLCDPECLKLDNKEAFGYKKIYLQALNKTSIT